MTENWGMSLALMVMQTASVIDRARSLFGGDSEVSATESYGASASLHQAADGSSMAGKDSVSLSGRLADSHRAFAALQAAGLVASGKADATLSSRLHGVSTMVRDGAAQIDTIAAENARMGSVAASSRTAAADRAVIAALRSQVQRTGNVVNATLQGASEAAGNIQAVDYKTAPLPSSPIPPPPHPGPVPPGKEWHYYSSWGWVLEDKLKDCSGGEEFWTLAQIAAGMVGTIFGGPLGAIGGIPAAGAGIYTITHCQPPGA